MDNLISKALRHAEPFLPETIWQKLNAVQAKKQLEQWKQAGAPAPPPHIVKQMTIKDYQRQYGYNILVETGTYLGEMVTAQKQHFKQIISIELGVELFKKAQQKFRNDRHVTILQGDSGKVLPQVVAQLSAPAIFWLDGHYSAGFTAKGEKECPIYEELDAILADNQFKHVLLIDDARCFIGKADYPTVAELKAYILKKDDRYRFEIKDDIIRCAI